MGETGVDNGIAELGFKNMGAWILGRNMFGPVRGRWPDETWKGWWGDEPPYHVPTFVLTHHKRAPIKMKGGTEFIFVTDGIESALERRPPPPPAPWRCRKATTDLWSVPREAPRPETAAKIGPWGELRHRVGRLPAGNHARLADGRLAAQHRLRLRREDDSLSFFVAHLRLEDDRRPTYVHRRTLRRGTTRCHRTQEVRLRFERRRTSPRGKVEKDTPYPPAVSASVMSAPP